MENKTEQVHVGLNLERFLIKDNELMPSFSLDRNSIVVAEKHNELVKFLEHCLFSLSEKAG